MSIENRNLLGIRSSSHGMSRAYGYDPLGNRIQIGTITKRPMHYGDVARFRT
jgi:hypothetical protein